MEAPKPVFREFFQFGTAKMAIIDRRRLIRLRAVGRILNSGRELGRKTPFRNLIQVPIAMRHFVRPKGYLCHS